MKYSKQFNSIWLNLIGESNGYFQKDPNQSITYNSKNSQSDEEGDIKTDDTFVMNALVTKIDQDILNKIYRRQGYPLSICINKRLIYTNFTWAELDHLPEKSLHFLTFALLYNPIIRFPCLMSNYMKKFGNSSYSYSASGYYGGEEYDEWSDTMENPLQVEVNDIENSKSTPINVPLFYHSRAMPYKKSFDVFIASALNRFKKGFIYTINTGFKLYVLLIILYRLIAGAERVNEGYAWLNEIASIYKTILQLNTVGVNSAIKVAADIETKIGSHFVIPMILSLPLFYGIFKSIFALKTIKRKSKGSILKMCSRMSKHKSNLIVDGFVAYFVPNLFQSVFKRLNMAFSFVMTVAGFKNIPVFDYVIHDIKMVERLILWDGRIHPDEKRNMLEALITLASNSHYYVKVKAYKSLSKLAYGHALVDIEKLSQRGASEDETKTLIYVKTRSLSFLKSEPYWQGKKSWNPLYSIFRPLFYFIGLNYVLWWIGQNPSILISIPILVFKLLKFGLLCFSYLNLFLSLLKAIQCPNRTGQKIGFADVPWADKLDVNCFNRLITEFRSRGSHESIEDIVDLIPKFHLPNLQQLNLNEKLLTYNEIKEFMNALKDLDMQMKKDSNNMERLNLTEIYLSNNNIKSLSDVWFPSELQSLHLQFNDLGSSHPPLYFEKLPELVTLDLSNNNINATDIQNLEFNNMPKLKSLDLNFNQIGDEGMKEFNFQDLSKLNVLNLERNDISDGIVHLNFDKLPHLTSLLIGNNMISDDGMKDLNFEAIPQLEYLSLQSNPLGPKSAKYLTLTKLPNLKTLLLRNCFLRGEGVKDLDFSQSYNLEVLDLRSNNIGDDSSNIQFDGLSKLKELYLAFNNLGKSGAKGLKLQPLQNSLTYLDLGNNGFNDALFNLNLNGLYNLEYLDLSSNSLDAFSCAAIQNWENLDGLVTIDLSSNFMGDQGVMALEFRNFPSLSSIVLTRNRIGSGIFSLDFSKIPLTNLDLSNNRLASHLSKMKYDTLSSLRALDISSNRIDTSDISGLNLNQLSSLSSLKLSNNRIGSGLKFVDFGSLSQLNSLYLDSNSIDDEGIQFLRASPSISTLDLSSNLIGEIGASYLPLESLPNLSYFDISKNNVGPLGAAALNLSTCTNLTHFDISDNLINDYGLTHLHIKHLENLGTLDLSANNITNYGIEKILTIIPSSKLHQVILNRNPLLSDEELNVLARIRQREVEQICESNACHANNPNVDFSLSSVETSALSLYSSSHSIQSSSPTSYFITLLCILSFILLPLFMVFLVLVVFIKRISNSRLKGCCLNRCWFSKS